MKEVNINIDLSDALIATAFHEAGHVVTAHFLGYKCDKIILSNDGRGLTHINYGADSNIAIALQNETSIEEFMNISKENIQFIAKKICLILVSGRISEANLGRDYNSINNVKVEHTGPDFIKAESISKRYGFNLEEDINKLYQLFRTDVFWNSIKLLVFELLCYKKYELSEYEINSVLQSSGLFNIINKYPNFFSSVINKL